MFFSPLMNIMLIPGLEHCPGFFFLQRCTVHCVMNHSSAQCIVRFLPAVSPFPFILNDTSYLLNAFVSGAPDTELIRMLFVYFLGVFFYDPPLCGLVYSKDFLETQSHSHIFSFIFHSSKQL